MEEIEPIRHVKGLFPAMVTQIIGEDEIMHFSKHGGNAIGLSPDEGPLISKVSPCYGNSAVPFV